jgi:dihydroxyacetone kinase-like predicted kinase
MNPSVSQILDVVEDAASDSIIILPNNGNIIPTALQVKDLTHKKVKVVPTPGVIEGFAALLEYDPSASLEENFLNMERSFTRVLAAEVTVALRDASTPDGPVKAGNWLGLSRKGIEAVGDSLTQASIKLMDKLVKDSHEIVTIIEGEGSSKLSTRKITEWLEDNRPGILIEVHEGGQPLYPYLFSIE